MYPWCEPTRTRRCSPTIANRGLWYDGKAAYLLPLLLLVVIFV